MSLRIEQLSAGALSTAIADVARLRMTVFRAWPYLYDGDHDYELAYLAEFAAGETSIIVAAYDADDMVGAATGASLLEHTSEFGPLFRKHDYLPEAVFYCGESVLLPQYRGRGIGHAFFDHREAHARALAGTDGRNYTHSAFCGVVRDTSDQRCPSGYRPLDDFWRKRGYSKVDGMLGQYSWREVGDTHETTKAMQFWIRDLRQQPTFHK